MRKVITWSVISAALALVLSSWTSQPAAAQIPTKERAQISAVLDRSAYLGGENAKIAIALSIEPDWHVNSHQPTFEYLIPTVAEIDLPAGWPEPQISYPPGVMKTFAFEEQALSVYDDQVILLSEVTIPGQVQPGDFPVTIRVRYQACNDRSCLPPADATTQIELTLGQAGVSVNQEFFSPAGELRDLIVAKPDAQPSGQRGIAVYLLFGLLGGLLLNAMPCVLPVLSLKLIGLVKASAQTRRSVIAGSLATASGILISFWVLALAAIGAKLAGAGVGWGIQFQQPLFVVALTVVVLLFCLNLWGLFEVPLPGRIADWADSSGGEGLPAHFTSGLFATLLATPCSAPFLGTAISFGLSQTPLVIFAIFTAVGIGMASPYLALTIAPGTVKILPKPGEWMNHFKAFMGFLLAAAAVWLLYVLSAQISSERLAFVELALLALSLFIWISSRSANSRTWKSIATAGTLASIATALVLAAGGAPDSASASTQAAAPSKALGLISWVPFDRSEAERLAGSDRLVFVDVTADWCFTCKVNERLALETDEVSAAFQRLDVVAMKADWTNRNDDIARFLADHGRYGIPFYLLYRPGQKPHLFGELITKDGILEVLDAAVAQTAALEP